MNRTSPTDVRAASIHLARRILYGAAMLVGLLGWGLAYPGTFTWDSGSTTDNWSDTANWDSDGTPGSSDIAVFDTTATGVNGVNTVDTSFTIQKLSYGAAGATTTEHTTTIPTGVTLLVTGDGVGSLDQADFNVAHDVSTYTGAKSVTVTFSGSGTLQIGSTGTSTADIVIGRRGPSGCGAGTITTTVNMSGLASFQAEVDEMLVSQPGGGSSNVVATLRLAQSNTITANTLTLGNSREYGSSGDNVIQLGQQNTLQVDNIYVGRQKTKGTLQFDTGLTSPSATITNRAGTGGANLYVGYNDASGTGTTPSGLVDFTSGTITASFGNILLGYYAGGGVGSGTGTFKMAAGEVTATTLQLGVVGSVATNPLNTKGTLTLTGGSFTVNGNVSNGGGTATIQMASSTLAGATFTVIGNITDPSGTMNLYADGGTMLVTGSVAADNLRVGYNGLTASATFSSGAVVIGSGTGTNLYVGRRDAEVGGGQFTGTLNLAGATSVTINVAEFGIGTSTPGATLQGYPVGEVILSPNNTITANTIRVAYSEGVGLTGVTSKLTFGKTNVVNADTVIFGGSKGTAEVKIVSGGTLTLQAKTAETRADLYVGYQPVWTGGGANGTLDLSAGTFNATLDQLVIAQKEATGTGTTTGTMIVGPGTVTANQITLANRNGTTGNAVATLTIRGGNWTVSGPVAEPADGGSSTLNLDSGTMTISGNISVDKLRVGHDPVPGATATLTVQGGGTVRIGSGSSEDLSVGWRESANNTGSFSGTLDLSGASSAVIDVGTFGVGYVTGGSGEFWPKGTAILSPNNTITANTIYVAHSTSVGLGGGINKLTFGTMNVVNADTVIFGGSKGIAQVGIVSGGTLTLQGKTAGTRADLYVGYQPVSTGGGSTGTLDLTGTNPVTFNAMLDELRLGWKVEGGAGTTQGTLKFEAGHIDVNSILLGTKGGGGGNAIGTFIMNGGTLTAGSIAQGDGTGVFQFNAGMLHVGTFGTETIPFNLNQAGGILAPGSSIGSTTIYGNYNQALAGTLEIELAGLTSYDTVTIYGNADLEGTLLVKFLDEYAPGLGDTFNILSATGTIDISNLDLLGDQPPNSRWLVNLLTGQGGGEILQLQVALPEPSTWVLALLALGSLGLLKRLKLLPRA